MSPPREAPASAWTAPPAGEEVLVRTAPSKNLVLAAFGLSAVVVVVGSAVLAAASVGPRVGRLGSLAMLGAATAPIAGAFLRTRRREYVVTTDRVSVRVGLWRPVVTELPLDAVEEVTYHRSGWNRVAAVGTVRFHGAGRTVSFAGVENPHRLYERSVPAVSGANGE